MAEETGLELVIAALSSIRRPYFAAGDIPCTEPFKLLISSNASGISFPLALPDDLNPLLEACQQASFGRGNQDVLDPTYRRALVLHAKDFGLAPGSAVEPYSLGIISAIQDTLFEDSSADGVAHRVVAKVDKLNVYSEGDFCGYTPGT